MAKKIIKPLVTDIFLLFLLLFVSFVLPQSIFAQSSQSISPNNQSLGFSVTPPSKDLNVNPGDIIKDTVKVYNVSKDNIVLVATPENFTATGEQGYVDINENFTPYSIKDWITINKDPQVIKPNTYGYFDYTLTVPKNAEPGSHWGAILIATTKPNVDPNISESIVQQSIGSLILLKIPGNVLGASDIASFDPDTNFYFHHIFVHPHVKFNAVVENKGNVHDSVSGFITIYDIFGNKIKTADLEAKNVLPGAKRVFSTDFDFDLVGPYKVELNMTYSGKTITAYSYFTALNLDKTLPILAGVLILILFYVILRKRINKALKILIKGEGENKVKKD